MPDLTLPQFPAHAGGTAGGQSGARQGCVLKHIPPRSHWPQVGAGVLPLDLRIGGPRHRPGIGAKVWENPAWGGAFAQPRAPEAATKFKACGFWRLWGRSLPGRLWELRGLWTSHVKEPQGPGCRGVSARPEWAESSGAPGPAGDGHSAPAVSPPCSGCWPS